MNVSRVSAQSQAVNTKHDPELCRMSFGKPRPATGCPRCIELAAGAEPRRWSGRSPAQRRQDEANRSREIKAHNCSRSGCGPVCTAFDW